MGRVVEILVGISALAGIATFLGVRAAVRKTVRSLGRKPEEKSTEVERRTDGYHTDGG